MSRARRFWILVAIFGVGIGIEALAESSIGNATFGNAKGVYNALFGGLLLFIRDQFLPPELFRHTLLIAGTSSLGGLVVYAVMRKLTSNKYLIWSLVGLGVVALTFMMRVAMTPDVSDGVASASLVGAASGAVSGAVLARFVGHTLPEAGLSILGLCLGTLYHFQVATTWTTQVVGIAGLLLGLAELLAPALFGLILGVWLMSAPRPAA